MWHWKTAKSANAIGLMMTGASEVRSPREMLAPPIRLASRPRQTVTRQTAGRKVTATACPLSIMDWNGTKPPTDPLTSRPPFARRTDTVRDEQYGTHQRSATWTVRTPPNGLRTAPWNTTMFWV
jgi:hypothetical protein